MAYASNVDGDNIAIASDELLFARFERQTSTGTILSAHQMAEDDMRRLRERRSRSLSVDDMLDDGDSRNIRLFVCSSFRDMIEERSLLSSKVFPFASSYCLRCGFYFTEVDLRWGVLKNSEEAAIVATCLRENDRCNSFMIIILGERYGWVPSRETLADAANLLGPSFSWIVPAPGEQNLRSITELEIENGVFRNKNRRALIYMRNPNYVDSVSPEIRRDYLKDCTNGEMENLKARLWRECPGQIREYDQPEHLADLVKEDIHSLFLSHFEETGIYFDNTHQERLEHITYMNHRQQTYVLFPTHESVIDNIIKSKSPVLLYGSSGSGKSSLLSHTFKKIPSKHHKLIYFVGISNRTCTRTNILQHIINYIKSWTGSADEVPSSPQLLEATFYDWLCLASKKAKDAKCLVYIIVDAINQISDGDDELFWIPHSFPPNVVFICSSTPDSSLLRRNHWEFFEMPKIQFNERVELSRKYLQHFGKDLEQEVLEKINHAQQCDNPLFLKLLLDELRIVGKHEILEEQVDEFLTAKDSSEIYDQVLVRLEKTFNGQKDEVCHDLVERVLTFILFSRNGLTENELLGLLDLDQTLLLPFLHSIQDTLISSSGLFIFCHDVLTKAVMRRYIQEERKEIEIHSKLAEYFSKFSYLDRRRSDELPWHLQKSGNLEGLRSFLCNVESFMYLRTKGDAKIEMDGYWRAAGTEEAHSYFVKEINKYIKYSYNIKAVDIAKIAAEVGTQLQDLALYKACEHTFIYALELLESGVVNPLTEITDKNDLKEIDVLKRLTSSNLDNVYDQMDADNAKTAGDVLRRMSKLFNYLNKIDLCTACLNRSRNLIKKIYGDESTQYSEVLDDISWGSIRKKNRSESLLTTQTSLRIKCIHFFSTWKIEIPKEIKSPDVLAVPRNVWLKIFDVSIQHSEGCFAIAINHLAHIFQDFLRHRPFALHLHHKALKCYEAGFGRHHPYIATALLNIGRFFLEDAEMAGKLKLQEEMYIALELSKEYLEKAIEVRLETRGNTHPHYASALFLKAKFHIAKREYNIANQICDKVIEIRKLRLGNEHAQTIAAVKMKGEISDRLDSSDVIPELGWRPRFPARFSHCLDFVFQGKCADRQNCQFYHTILPRKHCRNYVAGNCKRTNCKFAHEDI